jgi:catechol 2,3-dioxygenase-like lactoylglutathione lyase family enzyme
VSGLNHVAIVTADARRLADFYVEVFGAEALDIPAPPGTEACLVRLAPTCGLAILQVPDNPHAVGTTVELARGHLDHIGIDVPSAGALEEVRRRLVARGASDGTVHDYGPMLTVPFVDPDGMASEACWMRGDVVTARPPVPFVGSLAALDPSDQDRL